MGLHAALVKNQEYVPPCTKGFTFAIIQSHFLVQAMTLSVYFRLLEFTLVGDSDNVFLATEGPMLFSVTSWNLAGKKISRSREKHLLLYEILFHSG